MIKIIRKNYKVKLGDNVRDNVTGYEGVCTSITRHLNGCRRIGIQGSKLDQNNLPVDVYVVDETTVEVLKPKVLKTEQAEKGGPNEKLLKLKVE